MVEVFGQLNLSCKVKKILLAARSHQFFQRQVKQFFLRNEVRKLEGFVEKSFVKIKSYLHRETGRKALSLYFSLNAPLRVTPRDRLSAFSPDKLSSLVRCFADTTRVVLLNFSSMDALSDWLMRMGRSNWLCHLKVSAIFLIAIFQ